VKERFWVIVADEMRRGQLGMAQGCEDHISTMIDRIANAVNLQPNQRPIDDIEDDFRRFVRHMVQDAKQKGYSDLHEDTYYAADGWFRRTFCPLFPFC
jgi:hypothetical protein